MRDLLAYMTGPESEILVSNGRYNIDGSNLDLLIENVTAMDSVLSYVRQLKVHDPVRSRIYSYSALNVTLHVYGRWSNPAILCQWTFEFCVCIPEPPVITSGPTSTVVPVNSALSSVTFQCIAEGSSGPKVSWKHGSLAVTPGRRYNITMVTNCLDTGRCVTTSMLMIMDIVEMDTGEVLCNADVPRSHETNDMILPGDTASAPFTVLGKRIQSRHAIGVKF